jgi:hypothetical protein
MTRSMAALIALCLATPSAVPAPLDAEYKVIYSNLSADPPDRYEKTEGWSVFARHRGCCSSRAMPFIPNESGHIRKIRIAITHIEFTNRMTVSLRADAGGVPGDIIDKIDFSSLPTYGTCCRVQTWKVKGIPVVAGSRYWLVARASEAGSRFWWNANNTGAAGTSAYAEDGEWHLRDGDLGAFSVLGR